MLKTIAKITVTASIILLAACAGEATSIQNSNNHGTIAPTQSPAIQTEQLPSKETEKPDNNTENNKDTEKSAVSDFQAGVLIDWSAAEDQLTENHRPALITLNNGLVALVEHDYEGFRAGFVTEELADTLGFYYDDKDQFVFTDIENIYIHDQIDNQLNITVTGQRLDTETGAVEDIKYLYAIRLNDQDEWKIYTID